MSPPGAPPPHSTPLDRLLTGQDALAERLAGIDRAAATAAPVLLVGEPGTGRTALARALHAAGPRAERPLVEVDVGAIPPTLFESELFGHLRGAFTGAAETMRGRVERADGGTLLLDHVEELPLAVQPKLLRLLSAGVYAPLGGSERTADVRFVAVAADDLPERMERGSFREDLYYRLEVLAFRIPPLRERRRDLATLVDRLLVDLAERLGRPVPELAVSAREWMLEHPWPGNLRQLRNVLEREMILAQDGEPLDPDPPPGGERPPRSLAEVEEDEIRRALAYTRGHQGRAAELLGISRKTLWEKRKRYGIP